MYLVDLLILNFYYNLVLPSYFLKWNRYFSTYENLLNSSCQFRKHKSVFLQILHQSPVPSNITPLDFFNSSIIYFGQKEPIKMYIFETFRCSGQHSSKSSCQFWNGKSIPLQILHHSSLPWHITSLPSLSSYIFYFE